MKREDRVDDRAERQASCAYAMPEWPGELREVEASGPGTSDVRLQEDGK